MSHVRRAGLADVEAIRRVGYLTWPATYLGFAPVDHVQDNLTRWWSVEAVERSITASTTYVAEVDGEVVGTATVGELDGTPVVWKLYVAPAAQGTGVGSELLRAAVADVDPSQPIRIEYALHNEHAAAFYRRLGFVETGREPAEHGMTTVWAELPARSS